MVFVLKFVTMINLEIQVVAVRTVTLIAQFATDLLLPIVRDADLDMN